MRYLLLLFIGFVFVSVVAQDYSIPVSKIKPITIEEFNQIKTPEEGSIILIKNEGTLMYFSNSQWYALKGECYPKTKTPKIDSVVKKENQLYIYFKSTENLKYEISMQETDLSIEAKSSPAILDIASEQKKASIVIRALSKCDNGSPEFFTWEEK